MAVPIGAILKKAAVALGSNKKVLKTITGIALGIVVIVCMPIIALLGIFSGGADIEIDTGAVYDRIEGWQPDAESVFETVEEKMEESGFSEEQIEQARALYSFTLFRFAGEENFAERLAGCFAAGQTDEELISSINAEFGTAITSEEFCTVMEEWRAQKEGDGKG